MNTMLAPQKNQTRFCKAEENQALQISGVSIWEYNINDDQLKFHDNWVSLLGYNQFELPKTASDFHTLLHPADLPIILNTYEDYIKNKTSDILEVQFRIQTKQGKWIWVRNRSVLEYDQTNAPLKWIGSVMEISRLKKSENEAVQNNIHLNAIVNSLSDIIFEINHDYIFVNCWIPENNPFSQDFKAYKGQKIIDVYGVSLFNIFKQVIDKTYSTGKQHEYNYYAKKSNRHFLAKAQLLPKDHEGSQNVTMVIQDISEIRKTQLELEKKEANLNAIIQNTSDVFWAIDKDEKLIVFNSAFKNLYYNLSGRYPKTGSTLDDSFLLEETAKRWRIIHDRSLAGKDTEFSKHVHFTDGRVRLYEFHINPFKNSEGKIVGSVVTGRDIDDIYTAKKQAEKASRLKSKFVSTISHEIRTPLNAILGTCHQLERNNRQKNLTEDIDILNLASENLLSLINDVLDFTKSDSGKAIYKPSHFNLAKFLTGISVFLGNLASKKGLEFKVNIPENLPQIVSTDKAKVHQILTNLLSNAIKYTDEGTISFSVETNYISESKSQFIFNVSDTGIGIPESDLHGIFDSFTQSTTSYDMLKGGTGLGLTITKNLVNLLGGKISVESENKKGSSFNFELEVETPSKKTIGLNKPHPTKNLKGIKILVAEDNVINAKIITRLLNQWEAEIDLAENGEIAVILSDTKEYDLILMDIQMPKMNGFQASNEIRHEQNSKNINTPILALTAQPDFSFDPSYTEGIFNGYILKPFHPDNLKSTILEIVQ